MKIRPHMPPASAVFTMCILVIVATRLSGFESTTRIAVKDGFWEINGKPTYEGAETEGLLMGVRMVNCTFDDRNAKTSPRGFDADKNTEAFLKKLPRYISHGVNTIILNLQGGDPGYAGSINSAFNPDGSLREADLKRLGRVIEACDKIGAVVILGYFSPAQDQVLRDEAAVKDAVSNASAWLKKKGYTNVLVQVAEEHTSKKYNHAMIASPEGCASLIKAARAVNPDLLVSASGAPNGRVANAVGDEASILLPRFNSTPLDRFNLMVVKLAKRSKAIVSVDDSKTGKLAVTAMNLCVQSLCSWTYSNLKANQHYPFTYQAEEDDPGVYGELKKIVGN